MTALAQCIPSPRFPRPPRVLRMAAACIALCMGLGAQAQTDPQGRAGYRAADTSKNDARSPEFAGEDGVRRGREQAFITRVDSSFLDDAAKINMAELQASDLAVRKATNPQLRAFAQQLQAEHRRNDAELRSLAARKGIDLPDAPPLKLVAQLKALEGAEGAEFDRSYIELVGVEAHLGAIERYETAAERAGDEDVRAFARRSLPVLQRHLARARTLAGGL